MRPIPVADLAPGWRKLLMPFATPSAEQWTYGQLLQQRFVLDNIEIFTEYFETKRPSTLALHCNSSTLLCNFTLEGEAHLLRKNQTAIPLTPRHYFLFAASLLHCAKLLLPTGSYYCFYIEIPATMLAQKGEPIQLPLRLPTTHRVRKIIDAICHSHLEDFALKLFLTARVLDLLHLFFAHPSDRTIVREKRMKMVMQYIEDSLAEPLQDMHLAELYGSSVPVFRRAFKQYFHKTPHHYVMTARMEKAKALLIETNSTMEEIAWFVGYSDDTSFNHAFLRHFKQPPMQFRNSYLNKK